MMRRARLLVVCGTVLAGAITVIGSTQTWLEVVMADGANDVLDVPGASALPVLAPLGLAVLALGAALSIVGPVLRYAFAALGVALATILGVLSAQVLWMTPVSAVASTVTAATGIAGSSAVAALVTSVTPTAWPLVTLVAQVVLGASSVLALLTARRWGGGGRRFTRSDAASGGPASRPHDAIDSWDDLSRGDDPTR